MTDKTTRKFPRPAEDDPRSAAGYQAFLDQAKWVVDWQWRRSESFERKAGAVLGFVGILVTLQTAVVRSIITVPRTPLTWVALGFLAFSGAFLIMAVVQSVAALGVGKYRAGNMDQLRREWEQYNGVGHLSDEGVIGLFADQLIREGQGEKSPIQSLHDDAEKRGEHFGRAVRALGYSIILMVFVLMVAAVQAAAEKENSDGRAREDGTATVTTRTGAGAATSTIPARGKPGRDQGHPPQ